MSKTVPCRIKKHMTVSTVDRERVMIFNYSCLPHGIWRKAFRKSKNRQIDIDEHLGREWKPAKKVS